MSTTKLVAPVRRERAYRTFIVLPPLAVAAVIGLGVWREHIAKGEFRSAIATHGSRNEAVGNASLTKFFDTETTRETSEQWQRIAAAATALTGKYDGTTVSDFDRLVPENEAWAAEAFANELSDAAQPILSELRELAESEKPVWLPLMFVGNNTRLEELQRSREIGRLLANEFRVAYHAGDSARAMQTLSLMQVMTRMTDWQGTTVIALLNLSFVGLHQSLIRESLAHDFWSEDELKQLRETLKPDPNLDERWKNMIAGDRAMAFAALRAVESTSESTGSAFDGRPLAPFGIAPTQLNETLSKMDEIGSVKGAGTEEHVAAIRQLYRVLRFGNLRSGNQRVNEVSFVAIPFALSDPIRDYYLPAFEAASNAFAMSEGSRRQTLNAVANEQMQE